VLALEDDAVRVRLDSGAEVDARARETTADALRPGGRCLVCVRPERLAVSILSPDQFGEGAMPAVVAAVSHLGPYGRLDLLVGGTAVLVVRPAGGIPPGVVAGRTISVAWQPHHAIAYPAIAPPA
jgi:putative spermidine/putrescine transport system ATP-binding protein